jgi:L-ascorbate metabolism protein UlaG (beta-lactamase superfamily)
LLENALKHEPIMLQTHLLSHDFQENRCPLFLIALSELRRSPMPAAYGRLLAIIGALLVSWCGSGSAEAAGGSRCIALAGGVPGVQFVSLNEPAAAPAGEVTISFVGHATFRIESSGGIVIATDYTGYAGQGRLPDVVTMNHAHGTHYTDFPDPSIKYVLRGWPTGGAPAQYNLTVGDVFIRNVTTDIRRWDGTRERDGNSIFIFEVADLCIGHLGHLHHTLGPDYLGLIGQLDVVMVPVDGFYTMEQASMLEVLKLLKARLVLPMHYFGHATLSRFLSKLDEGFEIEISKARSVTVSAATLPATPKVLVLPAFDLPSPE